LPTCFFLQKQIIAMPTLEDAITVPTALMPHDDAPTLPMGLTSQDFLTPPSKQSGSAKAVRRTVAASAVSAAARTVIHGAVHTTVNGQTVLDGTSGRWCVGAGHAHPYIAEAMKRQMDKPDFATSDPTAHPRAAALAERIADLAPSALKHVFLVNSGTEACDTALKIALAYWGAKGEGQRSLFVGRERGFHGIGFGGLSVGGMADHRQAFGHALLRADHLRATWDPATQAFVRGQPETGGAALADELENRIIALHGARNIAAVVLEPIACAAGVLVPPQGYLQRLRSICDHHGLLLIFDEVSTSFGRTGNVFAAQTFGVVPDMLLFAKTVSNGAAPLGGVIVSRAIHDTVMHGPAHLSALMQGYSHSGHPLACAAGHAMLDVMAQEDLVGRVSELSAYFADAVHSLADAPQVVSIRNAGLIAGIELAPRAHAPGERGAAAQTAALSHGLLIRATGDTLVLAPPFISTYSHIDDMVERLRLTITNLSDISSSA
jgi:beta-alanine--pyruvate transaminase